MRYSVFAAILAGLITVFFTAGAFATYSLTARQDALNKINFSGRQRMLTQRMSKAACFAFLGIETEKHKAMSEGAMRLFDQTLVSLRNGDPGLGLSAETDPGILAELDRVEELWIDFKPLIAKVMRGIDAEDLRQIMNSNVPLLVQMNKAVGLFEQKYAKGVIHPELAAAINISGRQRMLTQRASKEFCAILAGIDPEKHKQSLAKTLTLFDTSLKQLMVGSKKHGITEPISEEMVWQYEAIEILWNDFRPMAERALEPSLPSPTEVEFVADRNNGLLKEMNEAVGLYD